MNHQNIFNAALGFLERHQGEHLSSDRARLLDRCTTFLTSYLAVGQELAEETAIQAYGEIEARKAGCYIDMSRTTSCVLFVTDKHTGSRIALTIPDLLSMFELHGRTMLGIVKDITPAATCH